MEELSTWVMGIAGVCLVSVLVDLILPDGKMNGIIKNVFSFVIVLVVIIPLPNLIKGKYDFDNVFSEYEFEIQDQYVFNVNQAKLKSWKDNIESDLTEIGICGACVSISANIFELNMVVDAVYVDLCNVVISANLQNINIKMEVVEIVKNNVRVDKEKVVIYE